MRPSLALTQHREALIEIARRHGVENVRVFGSVVHGTDIEGSDIDLLVDAPRGTTLFDLAGIEIEASDLTGVRFDVCTPECLSIQYRNTVIGEAVPL